MPAWPLSGVALLCVISAACGDNLLPEGDPLEPAGDLTIIAHQDDDLVFMQPDLVDAVQRGAGVTNVYVTAGNGNRGVAQAEMRYNALLSAYGSIAGDNDWSCGWIEIAGHAAQHCRLATARVSLIFLGYPDGGVHGEVTDSLLHLWEGKITTAATIARRSTTYDQRGLVTTLAEIIDTTAPATLRTLDIASTHGDDHPDHLIVGALAVLATAASSQAPELISFRGDNTENEPVNNDQLLDRSLDALAHYAACATGCAPCGQVCAIDQIDESDLTWLRRRYAIGMRRSASGKLRIGNGCVNVTGSGSDASAGDCARAPTWQLDDHGALRSSSDLCLQVISTGEIIAGTCGIGGAGARFFLDDEGHLWSGAIPEPAAEMQIAHLSCVGVDGGYLRAELCGASHAPALEFARTTTATPLATTTITQTGRAVRLARLPQGPLPMLCAIEPARGLMCAPGIPRGGLLPAIRIDSATAPLAIEPESLVFGDVDGDGLPDACGRDAGGILCATAATGYAATRWTTVLGGTGPANATDRSLAITRDGKICGLGAPGVVCVTKDATSLTDVRSTWPDRSAALWIADLDGDHQPDWCAATANGPACSLAADREVTTGGIPWGYASGAVIEASAGAGVLPDTATAVFTDIDGDGRDDLCTTQNGVIACARSLSHGFGPRTTIASLPAGMIPTALWAETPVAGRAPRICAGDATTIACAD